MRARGERTAALRSVFSRMSILALAAAVVGTAAGGTVRAAEEPDYPHGAFEADCESCHSDGGWVPARIHPEVRANHKFPLESAHAIDDCRACHKVLDFTQASPECVDCHLDPHRGELGIECSKCHTPRTFIDRTRMQRDHQSTRFPLRGSHRALDCEDCHELQPSGALRWVNTRSECVDCHLAAYQGNPQHVADGFPLECDRCHAPTVWEAGRFDHAGIVDGCVACHRDDYDRTNDPNHADAGFPTTCENCHGTRTWDDANFDHAGIVDGCVACHRDDYDRTNDPNHADAGFPTTCENCHGTRAWGDADFDHTFPIFSGVHNGRWDSCSTCHVNPSNFSDFSCFGCHPHSDETKTRGDHGGVEGFEYVSSACYACHPDGRN